MDIQSILQAEVAILLFVLYIIVRLIIIIAPYTIRFIKWIFNRNHKQKTQEETVNDINDTLNNLIISMNELAEVFREHKAQIDIMLTKHEGRIDALERDVKEIKRNK